MLLFDFSCMGGFVLAPPWLLLESGIWFGLVSVGALSHHFAGNGGGNFLITTRLSIINYQFLDNHQ